jgi:hypothetical protein
MVVVLAAVEQSGDLSNDSNLHVPLYVDAYDITSHLSRLLPYATFQMQLKCLLKVVSTCIVFTRSCGEANRASLPYSVPSSRVEFLSSREPLARPRHDEPCQQRRVSKFVCVNPSDVSSLIFGYCCLFESIQLISMMPFHCLHESLS